jgi:hypothetical protein
MLVLPLAILLLCVCTPAGATFAALFAAVYAPQPRAVRSFVR